MKAIKNLYVVISLIVLMILRPFAPGEWFGSIVIAGLFVTWLDTMHRIWKSNADLTIENEKIRYAIVFVVMVLVGVALLILIVVNLVIGLKWLNLPIVLDECTLLALLICLSQNTIVDIANSIIKNSR